MPVIPVDKISLSSETITQPTEGFDPVLPIFRLAKLKAKFIKNLSSLIIFITYFIKMNS